MVVLARSGRFVSLARRPAPPPLPPPPPKPPASPPIPRPAHHHYCVRLQAPPTAASGVGPFLVRERATPATKRTPTVRAVHPVCPRRPRQCGPGDQTKPGRGGGGQRGRERAAGATAPRVSAAACKKQTRAAPPKRTKRRARPGIRGAHGKARTCGQAGRGGKGGVGAKERVGGGDEEKGGRRVNGVAPPHKFPPPFFSRRPPSPTSLTRTARTRPPLFTPPTACIAAPLAARRSRVSPRPKPAGAREGRRPASSSPLLRCGGRDQERGLGEGGRWGGRG